MIGVRPGELLGIKWADIHGNRLSIKRSINDEGEVSDGKNEGARRQIDWPGKNSPRKRYAVRHKRSNLSGYFLTRMETIFRNIFFGVGGGDTGATITSEPVLRSMNSVIHTLRLTMKCRKD